MQIHNVSLQRSQASHVDYRNTERVTIRKGFMELVQDIRCAILLEQCLTRMEQGNDFELFMIEEQQRKQGQDNKLKYGFFRKGLEEFKHACKLDCEREEVAYLISRLIVGGWLERRDGEGSEYYDDFEYRVNFLKLQEDLMKKGNMLGGYRVKEKSWKLRLVSGDEGL